MHHAPETDCLESEARTLEEVVVKGEGSVVAEEARERQQVASPSTEGAGWHDVHKRPYVGVSQARSWSPWLVLGAILWAIIAQS